MRSMRFLPLLLPLLAGCAAGKSVAERPPSGGEHQNAQLKVALLTPGPVSDAGWSAMAFEGLQAIQQELGARVDNQEAKDAQIRDAMRSYAQKGYGLVIGHGFEYNEPAMDVAKDFPDTVFVSSSGGETAKNVGAFRFLLEESFYLSGMMAGKMSKTGVVGMVGVGKYPSIVSTFKAFEAGVKAANPNVRVIPAVYFGTEGDVAGAKQLTERVIEQGADFVIHQANAAAQGVFDAAKERKAYAFGSNANQNDNPSGAVIASATIIARPAFVDLAKRVKARAFEGRILRMGIKEGTIDFVLNPALKAKVPPEVVKAIDQAKAKIKAGTLVVPKDEF